MHMAICGAGLDAVQYLSCILYGLIWEQSFWNHSDSNTIAADIDKIALVRQAINGFPRRGSFGYCDCFGDDYGNRKHNGDGHRRKYANRDSDYIARSQWAKDNKRLVAGRA